MKAFSTYGIFLIGLMLLFSCKKTDLITYNGNRLLYFSIASTDSISINFSLLPESVRDSTLRIGLGLLGNHLETPGAFNIAVDNSLTTAVAGRDFELANTFNYPAGMSMDTIEIKFNRTERMALVEQVLILELKPNELFSNALFDVNLARNQSRKLKIYITDLLVQTPGWSSSLGFLGTDYYMGRFTRKKMELLVQVIGGRTLKEIYEDIDDLPSFYASRLNNYLIAQRTAGTPVYEDDGTLMKAGLLYN